MTLKHPEYGVERFGLQELPVGELRAETAALILRKGVAVEGTVTRPDGKPATGAAVGLLPEILAAAGYQRTKTDENGHYHIVTNEPGKFTVAAAAENHARLEGNHRRQESADG